jgi:hypothetical protein
MHLIVHIFKKDVRHLWWGIAVALLLRAWIAFLDARGATADLPDFSLLLMVAWACLIALAVQDDPLAGDRQFWITRPLEPLRPAVGIRRGAAHIWAGRAGAQSPILNPCRPLQLA